MQNLTKSRFRLFSEQRNKGYIAESRSYAKNFHSLSVCAFGMVNKYICTIVCVTYTLVCDMFCCLSIVFLCFLFAHKYVSIEDFSLKFHHVNREIYRICFLWFGGE